MCVVCQIYGSSQPAFTAAAVTHGTAEQETVMESGTGRSIVSVPRTGDQNVDGLLWGSRYGSGAFTFSFPATAADYGSGYPDNAISNNLEALNGTQQGAVRQILQMYASVANVTFAETTAHASANLRFAQSDKPGTAYAYLPTSSVVGGDSFYNNSSGAYDSPVRGNYAWHTFIHEIGHSLGLKHGQDTSGYGAMTYARDSMEFSVMTYRPYVGAALSGYTNETWGFAQSLMAYDIAALQAMYGANYNHQAGNTVYTWSTTTGETFINGQGQGAAGGGAGGSANRIFFTTWDGGGSDTYDLSNFTTNLTIDLSPGGWSSLSATQTANLGNGNYARGNVFNALLNNNDARALIENATGGSGNDVLTGNSAANRLVGGSGNDTIRGGGGNDVLDGGTGSDQAVFSGSKSSYRVSQRSDGAVEVLDLRSGAPDGTDICWNIDTFVFADGVLTGPFAPQQPPRMVTQSDTANQFTWSSMSTTLDGADRVTAVVYKNDDATYTVYEFDVTGEKVWSTLTTQVDAAGRATAIVYANDDASQTVYEYDLNSDKAWSTITKTVNAAGQTTEILYTNDNGTLTIYEYDLDGQARWTSIRTQIDTSGRAKDLLYTNDDGTFVLYEYDVAGQFQWNAIETTFDANWRQKSLVYHNDDGTLTAVPVGASPGADALPGPNDDSWFLMA